MKLDMIAIVIVTLLGDFLLLENLLQLAKKKSKKFKWYIQLFFNLDGIVFLTSTFIIPGIFIIFGQEYNFRIFTEVMAWSILCGIPLFAILVSLEIQRIILRFAKK